MANFKTAITLLFLYTNSEAAQNLNFQYAVNLKNGGLLIKEKEFLKTGNNSRFELERWYRSRSLFLGVFGQGWCSSFDEKLVQKNKGQIELITCDSPRPVLFEIQPQADHYSSSERPDEKIRSSFGSYARYKKNTLVSQFDFRGELKALRNQNQLWKIKRNERKLIESLAPEKGSSLTVEWHPLLSTVESLSSARDSISFRYQGLVLKKAGLINYQYDDLDNLTKRLGNSDFEVQYDRQLDRVTGIKSQCEESYTYKDNKKFSSQALIKCPQKEMRMAFTPDQGA